MNRLYSVNHTKKLLGAFIYALLSIPVLLHAQTTYTWNVSNGSWTSPSSWNPARNTPASTDILVFNGSVIPFDTITGFSKDNISRLRIINNAQVYVTTVTVTAGTGTVSRAASAVTGTGTQFTSQLIVGDVIYTGIGNGIAEVVSIADDFNLVGSASNTATAVTFSIYPRLTISGATQPNLDIQGGSAITFSPVNPNGATIYLVTGAKADIRGTVNLTNGRSRLLAADSNSIVFKNGSVLNIIGTYAAASFPLGSVGARNVVTFDSGSTYYTNLSVAPFGLTPPDSKVLFAQGSTYRHESSALPANLFNGRTMDLFILNASAFNNTTIPITNPCTIDSLVIQSATELGFNASTAGSLNIRRSLVVNSGTFSLGTGSAVQNLNFNGISGMQSITGSGGTITLGTNGVVTVNNPAGIRIDRQKIQIPGALVMTQGNIKLNNDSLILGTSGTAPGLLTYTAGNITGQGSFTRWFGTANTITLGVDSGRFPMGTDVLNRHLWVGGRPTTAGNITVTHNDVAGQTYFTSPFSDNASNNVTVNVRQNVNWVITPTTIAGTNFGLKIQGTATGGQVSGPFNMRITLGTGVAPGTSADGSGTNSQPAATRTGLSAANLNNIFYMGADSAQNALPVKLISLNAVAADQSTVYVLWETAAEINTDRFETERSMDGKVFEKFASVKAKGNSAKGNSYVIADKEAFRGSKLIYYRLKMIDRDGAFEYSKTVSVKKESTSTIDIVKATPNPTAGDISFAIFSATAQPVKVEVIDLKGSACYSADKILETGTNNISVNMGSMEKGIYFMRITGNNEVKHFKVLRN